MNQLWNGFPGCRAMAGATLTCLSFLMGCQKAAQEPVTSAPVTDSRSSSSDSIAVPATPPAPAALESPAAAVAMNDEPPALPVLPSAELISDLPPPTPLGQLPLAIMPAAAPQEIKPELSAAFDKLFDPAVQGEEWDAVHFSLVEAGPEATPVLKDALKSPDVARREQAASILSLLGAVSEPAIPELLTALNDESAFVRATSAAALASFSSHQDKAKATLLTLLDSKDPELRRLAATNLSILGENAADLVPRLTLALDDADGEVVRPIAQLLGQIGTAAKPALPKLQKIAFEQQGDVKAAATLAVELIEQKNDATSR